MKVGIIGAGRIGKVHAKNISMFVPEMEIKTIADPFMNEQTEAFAKSCGSSEHHQGRKRHSERSRDLCSSDLLLYRHPFQVHHRGCSRRQEHLLREADRL